MSSSPAPGAAAPANGGAPSAPNQAPPGPAATAAGYPGGAPHPGYGGYPPGGKPGAPYPGASGQAISQQCGPTPTLNSLLQGRQQAGAVPPQRAPGPGPYPEGGGPPPSGGYPPWDPSYNYRHPHNGPPRPPYGYTGGYPPHPQHPGGYPPHPQASGGYPQYPQQPGGVGGLPPPSTAVSTAPSATNPAAPATSSPAPPVPANGPPPHPGKHEGRPSQTWMPPVQGTDHANRDDKLTSPQHNSSNTQQYPAAATPTTESSTVNSKSDGQSGGDDDANRNSPATSIAGGAAVTPHLNSTNARPTPSPTGSSSSRSMSPAVGTANAASAPPPPGQQNAAGGPPQQGAPPPGGAPPPPGAMPPRPPSGPAAAGGPPPPGGYPGQQQPPMGPPPHMMYKMGPGGGPPNQQMPPYGGQPSYPGQSYHGGRIGQPGYGPGPGPGPYPMNRMSYPGYGQHYPPHSTWGGPGGPPPQQGMMGPQKGMAPQGHPRHPGGPPQYPSRPPHPQMKGYPGSGMANSYNGPPVSSASFNGPSGGMPPPVTTNSGGYPGYPNSAGGPGGQPQPYMNSYPGGPPGSQGGGPGAAPGAAPPTSTAGGANNSNASSGPAPTGPDGVPIHDENSQTSTLSDRSDGDRQTPKANSTGGPTNYMQGGYPHPGAPGSPHNNVPSPGGGMGGQQENSYTGWPGRPAPGPPVSQMGSQFGNPLGPPHGATSPSPSETSTQSTPAPAATASPSQKSAKGSTRADSLGRLYNMDDHPDRHSFLDKLLAFMEERGSPITQCPTISKNPLDLFRLYVYTKERGGYVECTKHKTWKDIAAQLGIGASSSGAYTLKKHYAKNLLAYECQFDRGGMDPAPLLAQVEGPAKKKAKAAAASSTPQQPPPAPSPAGSQDSRDSSGYSGSNSNQNSQDAYGSSPAPPGSSGGYPPPPGGTPGGPPPPGAPYNNYPSSSSYPPTTTAPPDSSRPAGSLCASSSRHHGHHHYSSSNSKADHVRLQNPFDDVDGSSGNHIRGHQHHYHPHVYHQQLYNQHQHHYNFKNSAQGTYPPPNTYGGHYPPSSGSDQQYPGYPNNYPPPPGGPRPSGWGQPGYMGPPPNGTAAPGAGDPYRWGHPGSYGPRPGYPPQAPGAQSYSQYPDQYQKQPPMGAQSATTPPSTSASGFPTGGRPPSGGPPAGPPAGPSAPSGAAGGPPGAPPMAMGPPTGPPGGPSGPPGVPPGVKGPPPGMIPRPQSPQHQQPLPAAPPPPGRGPLGPPRMDAPQTANAGASGGRPVILGTHAGAMPPAGYPSPQQSYNQNGPATSTSSSSSFPPGPPTKSGAPSTPPRPSGPPGGPSGGSFMHQGQRPPGYPGGSQPWQNRYPSPGYGSQSPSGWTPNSMGPRPSAPFGPYSVGSPSSWSGPGAMRPGMRPMYRPDMRPPIGAQRPGYHGMRGRELSFPPNCVESIQPLMMKRRKHCKLDVQPVEGWKLVMSLRSGLLMESTWALDCLNILLYDDNAFPYFGLGNMPGLFEAVLEHWRAALIAMFGLTKDMEPEGDRDSLQNSLTSEECAVRRSDHQKRKWWKISRAIDEGSDDGLSTEEELAMGRPNLALCADDKSVPVLSGTNYTKRPRFSEEDLVVEPKDDELFVVEEEERKWDCSSEGLDGLNSERWRLGGGNTTRHIMPTFQADLGIVPFVRLLRELGRKKEEDSTGTKVKTEDEQASADEAKVKEEPSEYDEDGEQSSKKEESAEDIVDRIHRLTGIVLRDPDAARNRWRDENLEEECYMRDEPSLHLTTEAQDNVGRRAVCVSTILRNLSFLPGNEYEFGRSAAFLTIAGRLLLLHHWYPKRTARQRNYDRSEEEDGVAESCSSLVGDSEWWWDLLHVMRENVMVILANVSGALELKQYDESVARPILHGLLEWAVSSSSYAQDPFPFMGAHSPVSPQRLAVETLCKLCVHEANVDLLLTTPPFSRIESLAKLLARRLYRYEDQVLREFSINLLYYLSGADSGMSRVIALRGDQTVGLLLGFIEQAEQNAMMVAQQHGVNALRDNPDSMGTSLDMLRRAASTLHNLSRHPENISLFVKHEQRLLALVMSQILDQGVAAILSSVLFYMGQEEEELQRQHLKQMEARALEASKREKEPEEAPSTAASATANGPAENGGSLPSPKENGDVKEEPMDTGAVSEVSATPPAKESKSSSNSSSPPAPASSSSSSSAPLVASAS